MATQPDSDPEPEGITFQDVDWDQEARNDLLGLEPKILGQLVAYAVIVVGVVYDAFILKNAGPTLDLPQLFTLNAPVIENVKPLSWDILSVEWVFLVTLAFFVFNVCVPLYQNQRLTMYYWRQYKKNRAAVVSLIFLGVASLIGLFGPMVLPEPSVTVDTLTNQYRPPVGFTAQPQGEPITGTLAHPLGTDSKGLDLLVLMVYGMRISLEVGLISMFLTVTIGTVVGATAAHMGGMVDEVLMRYVDLQQTFPTLLFLILLVYLYGGSLILIIALFGFFSWEGTARLVRSEALQRTEEEYVRSAEAFGASQGWIIRRHIIPNVSSTVITNATLLIPGFILGEATLSFLGFTSDDIISWGRIIEQGQSDLPSAPWISTFPGFALFFTVLAFNYVGDAIRDAIDPRQDTE